MIARVRAFLDSLGRFMARVWLTVLYCSVMLPFGVVARMRAARQRPSELNWRAREDSATDVSKAQRQF
jgi:hypothetical protein